MNLSFLSDLEMSFSTSFKHTSRVKYDVDFKSSSLIEILHNIETLKNNMLNGRCKSIHVGYDFTINDVNHIYNLIKKTIEAYSNDFSISNPPNKKLYNVISNLRERFEASPKEISVNVIKELMAPNSEKKVNSKEKKQMLVSKKSMERAIKYSKKNKNI